jgi:hypothetical protein
MSLLMETDTSANVTADADILLNPGFSSVWNSFKLRHLITTL